MSRLYRLAVHVPLEHVATVRARHGREGQRKLLSDVEARLARLGWGDAVAMQDPTAEAVFSATARRRKSTPGSSDGVLAIASAEPVRAVELPAGPAKGAIDPGMSLDVQSTLGMALAVEENPRHLRGLASTLEPAFVSSASLLRAKASLLDLRRDKSEGPPAAALADVLVSLSRGLGESVRSMWQRLCREISLASPPSAPAPVELVARVRQALEAYAAASGLPLDIINDQVRMAAALIASEGAIEPGDAPREVVDAGRVACRHIGAGVVIVDPLVIEALCPIVGREGYVSPSSLKLALATMKPRWSRIENVTEAAALCKDLSNASPNDRSALQARAELSRATRAIERQRWVTWYRAIAEKYPSLSAPGASGAPRIGSFKLSRPRAPFRTSSTPA